MTDGWNGMEKLARQDIRIACSIEKFFRENNMIPNTFRWEALRPRVRIIIKSTDFDKNNKRYYYGVIDNGRDKMLAVDEKLHEWIQAMVENAPQMIEMRATKAGWQASLVTNN